MLLSFPVSGKQVHGNLLCCACKPEIHILIFWWSVRVDLLSGGSWSLNLGYFRGIVQILRILATGRNDKKIRFGCGDVENFFQGSHTMILPM